MELKDIKTVITALLAKTVARGATEEEASSAAAKAQELLSKHRLSMAEIASETDTQEPLDSSVVEEYQGHITIHWQRILINGIAKLNTCECIRMYRPSRIVIFGKESDREFVMYMYNMLKYQINDLARRNARGMGVKGANSYRHGMTVTVLNRLAEQETDIRRSASSHALMILGKDKELVRRAYLQSIGRGASPIKGFNRRINADAYQAGVRDGHNVQFNRGLGGSAARKMIK